MGFFRSLKNFVYKADFFYTTELLRYKEQPEYRTLLGGILSLGIIVALIATFYNKVVDTLNKVVITATGANTNAADPLPFNITTMPGSKFMFGVEIWHLDLNQDIRYFDIVLTNKQFNTGQQNTNGSIITTLEPCTLDHWAGFPEIQASYERLSMNFWLCLPKDHDFTIQGKYSSEISKTLEVSVKRCTNQSDPLRPCAPPDNITDFISSPQFFTIYFLNPLLNPSSSEYLSYYLEDNNYIIFSKESGSEGILFMEQYEIQTDESILPFSDVKIDAGGLVSQFALKNPYSIGPADQVFCMFSFFKSGMTRTYDRSFQKIDEVLSYIGGLFGTIAICLMLINVYNSYSFEITLGGHLFRSKDNLESKFKKYNFFSFLAHLAYSTLLTFKCNPNWTVVREYYNCREQMLKQLDIMYLIERVIFLERAIHNVFSQNQLRGLHLQSKFTFEDAEQTRKRYKIKSKVLKQCLKLKEKQKKIDKVLNTTDQFIIYPNQKIKKESGLMEQRDEIDNGGRMVLNREGTMGQTISQAQVARIMGGTKVAPINGPAVQQQSESSSSEDEQAEEKGLLKSLTTLKKQAEIGNIVSQKIWEGMDSLVKKEISAVENYEDMFGPAQDFKQENQLKNNNEQNSRQNLHGSEGNPIATQLNTRKELIRKFSNSSLKLKRTNQGVFFEESPKNAQDYEWSWQRRDMKSMNEYPLTIHYNNPL